MGTRAQLCGSCVRCPPSLARVGETSGCTLCLLDQPISETRGARCRATGRGAELRVVVVVVGGMSCSSRGVSCLLPPRGPPPVCRPRARGSHGSGLHPLCTRGFARATGFCARHAREDSEALLVSRFAFFSRRMSFAPAGGCDEEAAGTLSRDPGYYIASERAWGGEEEGG